MVQFLSIIFFSWISSIFVGFFKSSCFFCVTLYQLPFSYLWKRGAEMRISLTSNVYRRSEKVVCVGLTGPAHRESHKICGQSGT